MKMTPGTSLYFRVGDSKLASIHLLNGPAVPMAGESILPAANRSCILVDTPRAGAQASATALLECQYRPPITIAMSLKERSRFLAAR
jgi:hypothetical protein